MKYINLDNGCAAIVDGDDYELVTSIGKWKIHSKGYAYSNKTLMHRLINKTPIGMHTDHINGNKLDNRKENLRSCTNSQNLMNQKKQENRSSVYKGVYFEKSRNKWAAELKKDGKKFRLGRYNTEEDAAQAYNFKALEIFGNFAKLNISGAR